MSKATNPTDTAYLIGFGEYENRERALVIASNPFQAKEIAKEKLPQDAAIEVKILGELRDRVITAQNTGLAFL